ncbi:serine/threonine protein kinase [Pseudomonas sp. S5(2021)]|nr:serine/threonine protein kinase [Pseudomonas sp. S5(2021)]
MKLADLVTAGRSPALPLVLALPDGELSVNRWLRVLPGQRYVGRARWQGRDVLAKLLVGTRAERHFQRELQGARLLAEQGLATPALLAHGQVAGQGGWLLFDFLADSESLEDAWLRVEREPLLSAAQRAVLGEALGAVARLHRQGLWQSDLHLGNLLRYQGGLYLIDGAGVHAQQPGQPLDRARVVENLALFFAQLAPGLDPHIEELLASYLEVNALYALSLETLLAEVARIRQRRWRDYRSKLGRDCSLFSVSRSAMQLRVVRRDAEPLLAPLLAAPDAAIETGRSLKQGGSATVACVECSGRPLVVKRYNIKGLAHWLKRCWRPSRAWHSWIEGNRLDFLGIATPRPLAVLEQRWLGLRRRSYLVTEFSAGEDLLTRLQPYVAGSPPEAEVLALVRLFEAMRRERISHGDLKGTNLFWDDGRWALIDLDALQHHLSVTRFARAFARDRARLLRNWPVDSPLHRLLDERLPRP